MIIFSLHGAFQASGGRILVSQFAPVNETVIMANPSSGVGEIFII